jgi:hypothetical protein
MNVDTGDRKSFERVALVVPTIRENCFRDFVRRWAEIGLFHHVSLIVMEDNPKKTFDLQKVFSDLPSGSHLAARHFCWEDVEADLGKDSWIIPRRSDTVRSYGYYWAWKEGFDYVLTLDDDCYPPSYEADGVAYKDGQGFVQAHLSYVRDRTRWFNTLNSVKPRGIPYYETGRNRRVVLNHGLWTNVLDYDAPYQLANPVKEEFSFDSRIVPHGSYFPMCGMNVMWRRDVTVLMYHLLMGQTMKPGTNSMVRTHPKTGEDLGPPLEKLPFDRFGDIWCGIFMKKICDLLNLYVTSGMPYIRHERASNPFANLKKEANGIEVNERLWKYVDEFMPSGCILDTPPAGLYELLGEYIGKYAEFPEHVDYFRWLGRAMVAWARLFQKERRGGPTGT